MGREPASDDPYTRARLQVTRAAVYAGVDWHLVTHAAVDGRVDPIRLHHVAHVTPFAEWVEMTIANEHLEQLRRIAETEARDRRGGDA